MGTYYLCPHCRGILNAKDDIILSAENSKGEKVTHKVDDDKVFSYGEHCKKYADPEWFL